MLDTKTIKRPLALAGIAGTALLLTASPGHAVQVNQFDSTYVADGQWFESDVRTGGTAAIVDLNGQGGALESDQPLPTGAARLTTDMTNAAKAEVSVADDYGTAGTVIPLLNLGYSYYKESVAGGNAFAAPSIKLTFENTAYGGDGYVTLTYEPYWNQASNPGAAVAPVTDQWIDVAIDADNGLFWQSGGFGQSNSFGGPPLKTLGEWLSAFDAEFAAADLLAVSMGVGTYNQGQIGYFDDVTIEIANASSVTYDFGPNPVPIPAALPLFGTAIAGLLGYGSLRRRHQSA